MRAWTPAALYLILAWALLTRGDGLLGAAERDIQVSIKGVAPDPSGNAYMVLLVDPDGQRGLPIWIGLYEAQAIAREMDGEKPERPLTHDLILAILQGVEARIERVVIDQLQDNTFFAKIELRLPGGGGRKIDARPSDAIAVALRAKAPVFVAAAVMREAVALNLTESSATPATLELKFGIQVQPLTEELKRFFGKELEGVLVAAVAPGSAAAGAGLQRGDVITALGGQAVQTPGELREQLERRGESSEAKLNVIRGGRPLTLALPRSE